MKNIILILVCLPVIFFSACKKDSAEDPANNATLNNVPALSSLSPGTVTQTTMAFQCEITSDGGASVTARGVCYRTSSDPDISDSHTIDGSGTGVFLSSLSGLIPYTTYYAKAYATNSSGTAYSSQVIFTTLGSSPVSVPGGGATDADGNNYASIILFGQEWLSQNLKTTKFCNGDVIPELEDDSLWINAGAGAWCYYLKDQSYDSLYGKLYNQWVMEDSRNVCPCGWHVPTEAEWRLLEDSLGGYQLAGGRMKSTGQAYWSSPNIGADNTSGFSAYPGSYRLDHTTTDSTYTFGAPGFVGDFWALSASLPIVRLSSQQLYVAHLSSSSKRAGASVRCKKD